MQPAGKSRVIAVLPAANTIGMKRSQNTLREPPMANVAFVSSRRPLRRRTARTSSPTMSSISPAAAQAQSPMRSHYAPTATARCTFLITRRTERYYLRESRREIHHEARKSAESRRLGVLGRRARPHLSAERI